MNADETMAGGFLVLKKRCSAAALQSNLVHGVIKGWSSKLNDCERVSLKTALHFEFGIGWNLENPLSFS